MNKNTVARTSIGTPIYSLLPLVSSVAPRLRSRNLTLSARAAAEGRGRMSGCTAASAVVRESELFIGSSTQFSNLYTAVDTPARGCVGVCVVFVRKYVLGHSRVSQPLNLRLCLLRHFGFFTSPYASPTCRGLRLNSCRRFRRFTPDPPPIPWAHLLHRPASLRPPLYTSTMRT